MGLTGLHRVVVLWLTLMLMLICNLEQEGRPVLPGRWTAPKVEEEEEESDKEEVNADGDPPPPHTHQCAHVYTALLAVATHTL